MWMTVMPEPRPWIGLRGQDRLEWGSSLDLATSAGTVVLYLGYAEEPGLVVRQFTLTSGTALALSGTNFHQFRPFITKTDAGSEVVRYVGTSRATSAFGITANKTLRLHEEEFLNERIPQGARVGVEIVTTGTPTSIRALIQARLFHAR